MNQSIRESYAKVDAILGLMDDEYVKQVPYQVRKSIKEFKDPNLEVNIDLDKKLSEQNLDRETLAILAIINYNFWCKDSKKKKDLLRIYNKNYHYDESQEKVVKPESTDSIFKKATLNIPRYDSLGHKIFEVKPEKLKYSHSIQNDEDTIIINVNDNDDKPKEIAKKTSSPLQKFFDKIKKLLKKA